MQSADKTLVIFGLDGVLSPPVEEVSVLSAGEASSASPQPDMLELAKEFLRSPNFVVAFVSSRPKSLHTATWLWLAQHLQITSYPKHTFLLLCDYQSQRENAFYHQSFVTLLANVKDVSRVHVFDNSDKAINRYTSLLKRSPVRFWRVSKVDAGHPTVIESSLVSFQ